MKPRVIALARQLLGSVSQDEIADLIRLLNYYNTEFRESDRVPAMESGSTQPADPALETSVTEGLAKSSGRQNVYMTSARHVCRCCGK
jgi:hypothetical protein